MPFTFVDRVPSKLGRVKITPENGTAPYYALMERADEPAVTGTPLSAANLNAAQETMIYQDGSLAHTFLRLYIATNGKDSNTGASTSTPMATIRGAIRKYAKWYKYIDLYLMDGTYTEDLGTLSTDNCSLSIRSNSQDMNKVTINTSVMLESHINQFRLYNITINMTASGVRPLSVNAGQGYAYRVRFNMPTASNSACINVYNGSSLFLSECVINPGTGAAVYGNQAMLIRAYKCTSERTPATAYYANNGTVIEYTHSMSATQVTKEENEGKCIRLEARPGQTDGSMGSLKGQYMTYDGLLLQWGTLTITPAEANVPTPGLVVFPIKYTQTPLVFCEPVTSVPENCHIGVRRDIITDTTEEIAVILTREGLTSTVINWFAIGPGYN